MLSLCFILRTSIHLDLSGMEYEVQFQFVFSTSLSSYLKKAHPFPTDSKCCLYPYKISICRYIYFCNSNLLHLTILIIRTLYLFQGFLGYSSCLFSLINFKINFYYLLSRENFLTLQKHQLVVAVVQSSKLCPTLWPHGLQHARPPCPSASPRVCPSLCLLHWWCRPAISSSDTLLLLPSIFPSNREFSNESPVHIRWQKYWSFSFSISPSSEYSGLISLKIDWFDFLAIRGICRNLLQHHSLRALIFWHSVFFTSPALATIGMTIALTIRTFVGRVMSLLFNTLSRFVTTLRPRSNHLLFSRLQSASAVIWEPKKRKYHYFHLFPFYLQSNNGAGCHDLRFF